MDESEPSDQRQQLISDALLWVVKIGSGVLAAGGRLDRRAVRRLAADVAALRRTGRQVVLVSSGAIASGFRSLGLTEMPRSIVDKQAAAALGQQVLMAAWAEAFQKSRTPVAQVLLTADDLDHRARYLNARHTLQALLKHGAVPIVNENDSVSFDEIKMGDNDRLSALVALLISAQLLVLLTNVEGLRRGGPQGELISMVRPGDRVEGHVGAGKSATGVGGMRTKLEAARLVGEAGVPAIIAPGGRSGVLSDLAAGREIGTFFQPAPRRLEPRRRWIATATRARGLLIVDAGARRAIEERGASLLPSGIKGVEGRFPAGSPVRIADEAGQVFARGLVSYSAEEIERVRGRRSAELPTILGYRYADEIVHRNDMVVD